MSSCLISISQPVKALNNYMSVVLVKSKVAIVVHAFYAKQFEQLVTSINSIYRANSAFNTRIAIDIYVTLPSNSDVKIQSIIDEQLKQAKVYYSDNYGMDLLPFFHLLPELQSYDWVLKLHTKNNKTKLNRIWFEVLVQSLIGSPRIFFDTLQLLQNNPNWCMAGIMPFFVSAQKLMLDNQHNIDKLAKVWQLDTNDTDWGFFAGSFYWVQPKKLLPIAEPLIEHENWFKEDFARDGQMAHATERLITKVASRYGDIGLLLPTSIPCFNDKLETNANLPFLNTTNFKQNSVISLNKHRSKPDPSTLVIEGQHSAAINHVFMQQLLTAYHTLEHDLKILQNVSLLDVQQYANDVDIDFSHTMQAHLHFLLVGRFNGYAHYVYPTELTLAQAKLIDWKKQRLKSRNKDLTSIIIPVFNHLKLTLECLHAIKKHSKDESYEVIVIDNGSQKLIAKSLSFYAKLNANVQVIHLPKNLNFSVACNYGFAQSAGDTVVFLNNDTQVTAGWLSPLKKSLTKPDVVAVQPKLLYFDETVQCAGVDFDVEGFGVSRYEGYGKDSIEVNISTQCQALTAACLGISAQDFVTLKGFDTWFINGQEDMDLCMRLQQLYPNKTLWYEADSEVYHHTSKSQGRRDNIDQNRAIFKAKWQSMPSNFCLEQYS